MSKYDKMRRQQDALRAAEQAQYDLASRGMSELADDSKRIAEVYSHAAQVLEEIDSRFEAATSLRKADVAFLFFATASGSYISKRHSVGLHVPNDEGVIEALLVAREAYYG